MKYVLRFDDLIESCHRFVQIYSVMDNLFIDFMSVTKFAEMDALSRPHNPDFGSVCPRVVERNDHAARYV